MDSNATTEALPINPTASGVPLSPRPSQAVLGKQTATSESSNASLATGAAPAASKSALSLPPLFKWAVSYTAIAALILVQLGYTMALAVEVEFGIARDQLLEDRSHLVSLGAPLLLKFVGSLCEALMTPGLLTKAVLPMLLPFALFSVGFFAMTQFQQKLRLTFQNWRKQLSERTIVRLWGVGTLGVGLLLGAPILMFVLTIVTLPAVVMPAFGLEGARAYIAEAVIAPAHCMPVRNAADRRLAMASSLPREKGSSAICAAVIKDGNRVDAGRVVLAGPDYVVLFDSKTGITRKVPTSGATVQAIDDVD